MAEFCAIGGQVTKRVWAPLGEEDYSSYISQIPDDVDGIYVGIGGSGLISFIKQYQEQKGRVDTERMLGNVFWDDPLVLKEVGKSLVGGATAAMTAADSNTPEVAKYQEQKGRVDTERMLGNVFWDDPLVLKEVGKSLVGGATAAMTAADSNEPAVQKYSEDLKAAYGDEIAGLGPSVFTYGYYLDMVGLIKGLEAVDGDVSDQSKLQEALAGVTLSGDEAPWGDVKLDDNRQAISDVYVKKIVKDANGDGVPDVQTFRRIPQVDQTFNGVFTPDTPAPDRTNPKCVKGEAPPWVGNAEEVDFSSK